MGQLRELDLDFTFSNGGSVDALPKGLVESIFVRLKNLQKLKLPVTSLKSFSL